MTRFISRSAMIIFFKVRKFADGLKLSSSECVHNNAQYVKQNGWVLPLEEAASVFYPIRIKLI